MTAEARWRWVAVALLCVTPPSIWFWRRHARVAGLHSSIPATRGALRGWRNAIVRDQQTTPCPERLTALSEDDARRLDPRHEEARRDEWGGQFWWRCEGEMIEVLSPGPDGKLGSADDVSIRSD